MKRTVILLAAALFALSCLSDPEPGVFRRPEVRLYAPAELSSTTAVFEYEVEWPGTDAIEACGLCWGTSPEPEPGLETVVSDTPGSGLHRVEITGLELGQAYRVRAFAEGRRGIFYSQERMFHTPVTFESKAFEKYLVSRYDTDGDGYISLEEAAEIDEIALPDAGVASLGGIEHCTGLKMLDISGNPVTEMSLPQPSALEELDCSDTGVRDLNGIFTQARTLRKLSARGMSKDGDKLYLLSRLESLDISQQAQLTECQPQHCSHQPHRQKLRHRHPQPFPQPQSQFSRLPGLHCPQERQSSRRTGNRRHKQESGQRQAHSRRNRSALHGKD